MVRCDERCCWQREAAAADDFRDRIRLPTPAALGGLRSVAQAETPLPLVWNVARTSAGQQGHPSLARARQVVHHCRDLDGTAPAWPTIRLVVIGHSHHARLAVDDTTAPNHPVVLMDCSAWIERYRDSDGAEHPTCQIGVVAGNDIRIYQFDPLP